MWPFLFFYLPNRVTWKVELSSGYRGWTCLAGSSDLSILVAGASTTVEYLYISTDYG